MTELPTAPVAVDHHAVPSTSARARRFVGLALAVLALVVGGAVAIAVLPVPAPEPVAAPIRPVPPAPPGPAAGSTVDEIPRPDPVDRITIEELPVKGGCTRTGCVVRHRLVNRGSAEVDGMFTVRVNGHLVSATPLNLPPGYSSETTTRISGRVLAAQPGRTLRIEAEFRVAAAPPTT